MDRQFSEDEAREVFARAAERQHAVAAKGEGLSLDELRAIGAEAGLDPAHIEAAARSVAVGEPETGRLAVGPLPRGVFRTVVLPHPPTDALWESVVADARRTFSAQGKLSQSGRIREWRNGNLRVSLEPEGDGARLHLQTRRAERTQLTLGGLVVAVMAVGSAFFGSLDAGADGGGMGSVLMLALVASALVVGSVVEQRRWADTREGQFDAVARRAAEAQTAGAQTAGAQTAGAQTAGAQTAGAQTAGAQTAGAQTAGAQTAGAQTAGAQTAGAQTAGAQTAGAQTAGAQTAGAQTAGAQSAGAQSAGAQSAEAEPSGRIDPALLGSDLPADTTPDRAPRTRAR